MAVRGANRSSKQAPFIGAAQQPIDLSFVVAVHGLERTACVELPQVDERL